MPTLTRATIEAAILATAGGKMAALGNRPDGVTPWMDATTQNGTNASLTYPIMHAVLDMGGTLADPNAVTDADLAAFTGTRQAKLIAFSTLNTLYAVLGQMDNVDWSTGRDSQRDGQLAEQVQGLIGIITERLEKPLGRQVPATHTAPSQTAPLGPPNDPFRWPINRSQPGNWPYP